MTPALTAQYEANALPSEGTRLFPEWLLLLFVFSMPWEDQITLGDFGTLSRAAGAAAFGTAMLAVLATGRLRRLHPVHLTLGLFLFWGFLTFFWSLFPDETWYLLQTYLQLVAMVWMLHEFAPTPTHQIRVMKAYVLGSLVSAVATIDAYLSGTTAQLTGATTRVWQRYAAEGFEPNDLCMILAISLVFSVHLAFRRREGQREGWTRWIWRLQPALVLFAGTLTASRTGSVALALGVLFVLVSFREIRLSRKALVVAAGVAILGLVAAYAPETAFDRIATLPSELSSGTLSDRVAIWRAAWQTFEGRPFVGAGLGATPETVRPLLGYAVVGHHVFLTALAETGVVGMLLLLGAFVVMGRAVWGMPAHDRRLWLFLFLVWMCAAMSLSWLHRKPTWFLFGLLGSQAAILARQSGQPAAGRGEIAGDE